MAIRRLMVLAVLSLAGLWLLLGIFIPILLSSRGPAFLFELVLVVMLAVVVAGLIFLLLRSWEERKQNRE